MIAKLLLREVPGDFHLSVKKEGIWATDIEERLDFHSTIHELSFGSRQSSQRLEKSLGGRITKVVDE